MKWKMHDGMERMWKEVFVDLFEGSISAFALGDWVEPRNTSVRTAGLRAKIWTLWLQNTKQEY
jgi:hypothetical protein